MSGDIVRSLTAPAPATLFRHRASASAGTPAGAFQALRLFLALLYGNVAMWIPGLEAVRPAQLAVLTALGLLAVEGATGRRRLALTWPDSYLLLAFLIASFMTSFTALWPKLAVESGIELAKCVAVYFLIALTVDRVDRLRSVAWTLVLAGLVPAIGTLHFYRMGYTTEGRAGWLGTFGNPNDAAYALVILLPFAYTLAVVSGWRGRLVAAFCILVGSAAIYTTFSRGGLLGLFAVLAIVGLRIRSRAARATVALLGIAVTVAVVYFWQRTDSDEGSLGPQSTVSQRVITIRAGLEMFADSPLLGVGLGCSVVGFDIYAPVNYLTHKSLVVHNTPVQALAETGLAGTLPYYALVAGALWGAHRIARRPRPNTPPAARDCAPFAAALEASLVGFLICGLFGGYLLSWFPYILFGLVSALRRIAATPAARPLQAVA